MLLLLNPDGLLVSGRGSTPCQLTLQPCKRLGLGIRAARIELLSLGQLFAGAGEISCLGRNLRLHEVRLGATGVIAQHLVHELLRLLEVTGVGRLVNLVNGRIGGEHRTGTGQSHHQDPRSCYPLEHCHVCKASSEAENPTL